MPLKKSAGFAFVWGDKLLLSHATGAAWRFYSIIKGGQEEGETLLQTALREVKEEANIVLSPELLSQVEGQTPIVVQNKTKVLTAWVIRITKPEQLGMKTTEDKKGNIHTIIPTEELQDEEIDWAGFVTFKDAETKIAPYQLPILERVKAEQGTIPNWVLEQKAKETNTNAMEIKLVSKEHGFRDYDVINHPRINRIKMPLNPVKGDIVNVYYDQSSKGGIAFKGSVDQVVRDFDESGFFPEAEFKDINLKTTGQVEREKFQKKVNDMQAKHKQKKETMQTLPAIDEIKVRPWFTDQAEKFVPFHQLEFLKELDDEGIWEYKEVFDRINKIVAEMPKNYQTQNVRYLDKTVYLHYFYSSGDWWILEKDKGDPRDAPEEKGKQHQAFGIANLNGAADANGLGLGEMGYISIEELREIPQVELDFHFEPTKVEDLVDKRTTGRVRREEIREEPASHKKELHPIDKATFALGEALEALSGTYEVKHKSQFEYMAYSKKNDRAIHFTVRPSGNTVDFTVKGAKNMHSRVDRLNKGETSMSNEKLKQWAIDTATENLERDFNEPNSLFRKEDLYVGDVVTYQSKPYDDLRVANITHVSPEDDVEKIAVNYMDTEYNTPVETIIDISQIRKHKHTNLSHIPPSATAPGQPIDFNVAYDAIAEDLETNSMSENANSFEYKLLMALLQAGFSVDVFTKELNRNNELIVEKDGVEMTLLDKAGALKINPLKGRAVKVIANWRLMTDTENIFDILNELNEMVSTYKQFATK